MYQPMPALLLALLVGTEAAAQPFPLAREQQQRRISLPSSAETPVPEVHVAAGVLTTLVFDAPLERPSVELEGRVSRFNLVDAGERTLALEPSVELGPEERLGLRARLKDGTQVALVLTSPPNAVDTRVDVARPRSAETLQALLARKDAQLAALQAQCGEGGPLGLIRAGQLDDTGVLAKALALAKRPGLTAVYGMGYRARSWAAVDVVLHNPAEGKPLSSGEVQLVDAQGRRVKVLLVRWEKARLAPGESGRVLVQTEAPYWDKGTSIRLELLDGSGGPPLLLGTALL